MKQRDLKAILTQAAQLRADLCIAIDRSLQSHFHNLPISSASVLALENGEDDDRFDALPISSVVTASATSEARSLASIRDALEVLEEQLESLQYIADQSTVEKNATIAELEESRGIFIRRLKQHRGQELRVIKEALSFAGAPRDEDFLLRRSYTLPEKVCSDTNWRRRIIREDGFVDEDISVGLDMGRGKQGKPSPGLFNGLKSRVLGFFNGRLTRVSGKCLLAVAGAAAVLTISHVSHRNTVCVRRFASLNGRERSGRCPKNWASVQSGGHRCMLIEPFKE